MVDVPGPTGTDPEPEKADVDRAVRESVAGGAQPSAPAVPDDVDDEAAYGTERVQGAAQPGPDES